METACGQYGVIDHCIVARSTCWGSGDGAAALGRQLEASTTPKHAIKRVDRFLGNRRFRLLDAWEALMPWVIGPRREVVIACDWTKVRQWSVLSASVIYRGRALPMLWAVMDPINCRRA